MKKSITLFALCILFCIGKTGAQSFSPISLTGYNWDAIAEATTAAANTTGPIDGSNYVMYSVSFGTVYNVTTGLPNNGVIASGTSTYQLGTYSLNNICYTTATLTTDSLMFVTPAAYSGLSLLCFSTEGNGAMNVTVRFTDNTTQTFTNQALTDWFSTGASVLSGFDRVNTLGGLPSGSTSDPKMFALNLPISCANRAKNIQNVKFENITNNPRNCILAISGAAMPTFSATSSPVTCSGGSNGSATVVPTGGIGPYTYTWSTNPVQTGSVISTLPTGVYSITSADAGLCGVTTTVSVVQALVPQPSLVVTSTNYTICAGAAITLSTSGAATYTWNTTANSNTIGANPQTSTTYTVGGYTPFNCYRTGSLNIVVNPLPVINFTTPASICLNTPQFSLIATPVNGAYSGTGINGFGMYVPTTAGVGTRTLSYTYTDIHGCTSIAVNTIVINALPIVTFTLSPNSLCVNSPTLALSGSPGNGTFTGTGVTGPVYTPSVAGAGTQTVNYEYTDANNCTVAITSSVIINTVPVPVFQTTKKVFCVNSPTLYLNAQPSGGIFSGPGTSAIGIFSPSQAGVGNPTIIYTYTSSTGCVGKTAFSATVNSCSGIGENAAAVAASFVVYPNPNTGSFTIKAASNLELTLVNDLGQVIRTISVNEGNAHEISIADLPSGIYFVTGKDEQQLVKQKIIVTK